MRAACPGAPVSLSTSDAIEPDPERRHALVAAWTELPDLVTANQGEAGILALCELLMGRGVGIEAGLLSLADAHAFVAAGIAPRCVRALIEPLDADPEAAVAHAAAMERALDEGGVPIEQVHHGDGIASWAVNRRAARAGTVYARAWRTRACCPTAGRRRATPSWSPRPWRSRRRDGPRCGSAVVGAP